MSSIIFHIDMNSYFAAVEQQANPHLRGKPIIISGKEGSRSVVVAASIEAKQYGIKTGMRHGEARRLCPQVYFVYPDGSKYSELTQRFFDLFKSYTDSVELYSIDEAFLDMTGFVRGWDAAIDVARDIKNKLKTILGEWITCSVGIADNKLLAKLASDLQKPDGLVVINDSNKMMILDRIKPTDLWGIGPRIGARLAALGIHTLTALRHYPERLLVEVFGAYWTNTLKMLSRGEYHQPVVSYLYDPEIKSVGRSYTLPKNTLDRDEIFQVLMRLADKCGRRLRQERLAGKTVQAYVRYADFTVGGTRLTQRFPTNDGLIIYKHCRDLLDVRYLVKPIRLVGVRVSNLVDDYPQLSLWPKERCRHSLLSSLDDINDRYGTATITSAYLLGGASLRRRVGGFRHDLG